MPAMPLVPLVRSLEVAEDDRHDLAEPKGHDGQVVAAQAQRGRAEQDAEDRGHQRANEQHHPEREVLAGEAGGREGVGVRADREERGVTKVEQPGEADDDVEAQCQQHEDAGRGEDVDPHPLFVEAVERWERHDQRQSRRDDRHAEDDRDRAVAAEEVAHAVHARRSCDGLGRCRGGHARSPMRRAEETRRPEHQHDHEHREDDARATTRRARAAR